LCYQVGLRLSGIWGGRLLEAVDFPAEVAKCSDVTCERERV